MKQVKVFTPRRTRSNLGNEFVARDPSEDMRDMPETTDEAIGLLRAYDTHPTSRKLALQFLRERTADDERAFRVFMAETLHAMYVRAK